MFAGHVVVHKLTGKFWGVGAGVAFVAAYLFLAGFVSKSVSYEDVEAIESLGAGSYCVNVDSFEGQVDCVRALQQALKQKIPDLTCGKVGTRIEPSDLMRRKHGCCYGRSRFLEKALAYYHIKTRHVALYDSSAFGRLTLLVPGVPSHAALEALTGKGWMGVDANENFVLMTKEDRPVTFAELKSTPLEKLKERPRPAAFYAKPYYAVYGLYSRHGMFYGFNLPAPEINYHDFLRFNPF